MRLKRGYRPSLAAQQALRPLFNTDLAYSALMALLYNGSIWATGMASYAILAYLPLLYSPAIVILIVIAARQQRAIENMIHDVSHHGWSRHRRGLADALANLLCAYPSGMTVAAYRANHDLHHRYFGSDLDPCRQRVAMLRNVRTAGALLRALPHYTVYFYREMGGSPRVLVPVVAWHVVTVAIAAAIAGPAVALPVWLLGWLVPALLVLPAIRLLAEGAEHDYERPPSGPSSGPSSPEDDPPPSPNGDLPPSPKGNSPSPPAAVPTEFSTTFDCTSPVHRFLLRPWNDYAHLVHHTFPSLPQSNLGKAHRILLQTDPAYADGGQQRTRLFP